MTKRDDDVLAGLCVPGPPEGLRERALAAAAHAGAQEDRWLSILRNRSLRLAWAAAVGVLALLHVVLSLRQPASRTSDSGDEMDTELAAVTTLPPAIASALDADDESGADEEVVR